MEESLENQYEVPLSSPAVVYSEIRRRQEDVNPADRVTSDYTTMNGNGNRNSAYAFAQEDSPAEAASIRHSTYAFALEGLSTEPGSVRHSVAINQVGSIVTDADTYTFAGDNVPNEDTSSRNYVINPDSTNPSSPTTDNKEVNSREGAYYSIIKSQRGDVANCIIVTSCILAILASIIAIILGSAALYQISQVKDMMLSSKVTTTLATSTASKSTPPVVIPDVNECTSGSNDCHPLGGICVNTISSYSCFCKDGWKGDGKNCTEIKYQTCEELRKITGYNTGFYEIIPTGTTRPLVVKCVMDRNRGITQIGHDSESRILVDGCEDAGCYSRNITYETDMDHITGLIRSSSNCSQYIEYECYNSGLHHTSTVNIAWWVSRQGTKEAWSGGSILDSACTCPKSSNTTYCGCSCDINDSIWRKDSGYITNKTLLPVMQLRFGDVGDEGESGFHSLGKLECYG